MDPISNADRFIALMRQKLAERADGRKAPKNENLSEDTRHWGIDVVQGVAARAARAGLDNRKLRRTIVEQLLADRFGARLVNEPRFQEVVGLVDELMATDPEISAMLDEVIGEIRR